MTLTNTTIDLPVAGGGFERFRMAAPTEFPKPDRPIQSRTCFAAPHVVAEVTAEYTPGVAPPVDWDATLAFRRHLWDYGIGVAEAMDTSERGPHGLRWHQAQRLIAESLAEAREGDLVACGAGTEQLESESPSLGAIVEAYQEQISYIEGLGGTAIIRASHHLVSVADGPDDYLEAYTQIVRHATRPVIVHWLGVAFDPSLRGYWGYYHEEDALPVVLELVRSNPDHIAAIKFSCLNPPLERQLRASLPAGKRVYTGDDYDYPTLILGDGTHHSHGLLGVLDPLAPIASKALQSLDEGRDEEFLEVMESTVPLAKKMFEPPASDYKTGVVFLAYLSGHQDHFRMVSGREGMRSLLHLCDLFRLTDQLGLFPDPELAATRMRRVLAVSGVT